MSFGLFHGVVFFPVLLSICGPSAASTTSLPEPQDASGQEVSDHESFKKALSSFSRTNGIRAKAVAVVKQ